MHMRAAWRDRQESRQTDAVPCSIFENTLGAKLVESIAADLSDRYLEMMAETDFNNVTTPGPPVPQFQLTLAGPLTY